MNKDEIIKLLNDIGNNARGVMDSGRAGSTEAYYVQLIVKDVALIKNLLNK